MKIALCLHGKYNNRYSPTSGDEGALYLKETILEKYSDYNIDIFIHSWDLEFESKITKNYKNLIRRAVFEKQIDFKKIAVKSGINDNLFQTPQDNFRTCANSLSFFYSRKKVIELKQAYEKEHGFTYDIVLVSRFDSAGLDKFNGAQPYNVSEINFDPTFDMNYIYSAMWDQMNHGLTDQWFYSNSNNIDKLAELFDKSLKYFLPDSPYIQTRKSGWPDSNAHDEFSNEIFKTKEFKSKDLQRYEIANALDNHAIYKWFFIDCDLYKISRFV